MAVFCSSLTSWFPGMVFTYFLNDFEMVPVAPIITGITLVLHSTYAVFLLQGPFISKSPQLLFESHSSLLEFQHLVVLLLLFTRKAKFMRCHDWVVGWCVWKFSLTKQWRTALTLTTYKLGTRTLRQYDSSTLTYAITIKVRQKYLHTTWDVRIKIF
jgi:hypothetical protein